MNVVRTGIDDLRGVGRGADDVKMVCTGTDVRGVGRGADDVKVVRTGIDVRGVVEGQMM